MSRFPHRASVLASQERSPGARARRLPEPCLQAWLQVGPTKDAERVSAASLVSARGSESRLRSQSRTTPLSVACIVAHRYSGGGQRQGLGPESHASPFGRAQGRPA